MKKIDYRQLYLDNGFFWNDDLAAFVKEYAGQEIKYPNDSFRNTRFCDPAFITSLKGYGAVERMADYLGEAVAPVAEAQGGYTLVFMTESGQLFGFSDYLVSTYGDDAHWREAMGMLLAAPGGIVIGHVDGEE